MASTFTKSGAKATTQVKLDKAVFGVEVKNHQLLKDAYDVYLANGRDNLAVTKTRGLVRGGGKKPWRQKGTGRARTGSLRGPIHTGGGIVFGPTGQENYSKSINKKAKQLATRQALSLAASDDKIIVIEELIANKTSELAKVLAKVGAIGTALLVVDSKTEALTRASNNIPTVKLVNASYLNVFDVMNADKLVISQKSLVVINEWLASPAKSTPATGASK